MVTNSDHPTFPNPTIQEALCEIRFRLGEPWRPSFFGDFYKEVQSEFPNFEPMAMMGLHLQIGAGAVGQAPFIPQQIVRYRHANRNVLLQLSPEFLTVNQLPRYPGWMTMRQDVLNAWAKAAAVLQPAGVARVALRYINRIPRRSPDERPHVWIAPSMYVPEALVRSSPGFLFRLDARQEDGLRFVVTLGEALDPRENAILFDIDYACEKELPPNGEGLASEIDRLHECVWKVFASSMTDQLRRRLEGAV